VSDPVAASVRGVIAAWRQEVQQRHRVTKVDPAADAMELCASELESELARVEAASKLLTVEQYARATNVSPSSVRRWCLRGELAAERTPAGDWIIARSARRVPRVRQALRKVG